MCLNGKRVRRDAVQRLPPDRGVVCRGCGAAVRFRVVSSVPARSGGRYEYLVCPICGQRATRMRLC